MADANINDRATIELAYPRERFELDVRANAEAKSPIQKGVRIASAPDAEGRFSLSPASRHAAELEGSGDTVFLAPFAPFDGLTQKATGYGEAEEQGDALEEVRQSADAYAVFIDRIIETARSAHFQPAVGRHEESLKGFRGG